MGENKEYQSDVGYIELLKCWVESNKSFLMLDLRVQAARDMRT